MQQVFRAHQPVAQHFEESALPHIRGRVEVARERTHGFLVDFEKQSILAAEMLKDRSLGDAERGRDIADPGGVIALLGKMAHGSINDSGSLAFGPGPGGHAAVTRRRDETASNSTHSLTSSHKTLQKCHLNFNSIFSVHAVMYLAFSREYRNFGSSNVPCLRPQKFTTRS